MNSNINSSSVRQMKELNSFDPDEETRQYNALPFYLRLGQGPDFYSIALGKRPKRLLFGLSASFRTGHGTISRYCRSALGEYGTNKESTTISMISGRTFTTYMSAWLVGFLRASCWTARAWDDIPDRVSIIIGMNLYEEYPNAGLTGKIIMDKCWQYL